MRHEDCDPNCLCEAPGSITTKCCGGCPTECSCVEEMALANQLEFDTDIEYYGDDSAVFDGFELVAEREAEEREVAEVSDFPSTECPIPRRQLPE